MGPCTGRGRSSCIWTCRRPYDLESLSRNARSKVRRGLARCRVRGVTFREIVELGRRAHADTVQRHGQAGAGSGVSTDRPRSSLPGGESFTGGAAGPVPAIVVDTPPGSGSPAPGRRRSFSSSDHAMLSFRSILPWWNYCPHHIICSHSDSSFWIFPWLPGRKKTAVESVPAAAL